MTVSTTLNKQIFPGDGASTVFNFSFAFPGGTATQESANIQVYYTDALGNVTLLSPSVYTIGFNAATGTNPTPVGGSVTYNPSGTPIPLGSFLTIYRNLPLTQGTSLANQGTLYQPVTEAAFDYQVMVSQQILEVQSRALVVAVSDPTPSPLPAAAQRAGGVLGFDVNGNPIIVSTAPAGTISSAMAPVVSAASLAAGRTALGLGSLATFGAGTGLSTSGGLAFPAFVVVTDAAGPVSIGNPQHMNMRVATAAVTYNIAQTSGLVSGFYVTFSASGGNITLTPNAADAFNGMATGASLVIPQGSQVTVTTDIAGKLYVFYNQLFGDNAPLNLQINASVAASALTIALKDRNGNDPSPSSPVIFVASNGGNSVPRAITTPLSLTVPSGASLGTVNGQANRIWIGLFDNNGTPVLGVYNSLLTTGGFIGIYPWDETSTPNTTGISAGATSAQAWYTSGALTAKPFRIIGFVESTQATAGTWTTSPSKVQLYGPGQKKPGDTVQEITALISSPDSFNTGTFVSLSNNRASITPLSAANLVRAEASGFLTGPGSTGTGQTTSASLQLSIGTTNNTNLFGSFQQNQMGLAGAGASQGPLLTPAHLLGYILLNTTNATTISVQGRASGGSGSGTFGGGTEITLREIQV